MKKAVGILIEDNSKPAKKPVEIAFMLSTLNHYEDNPKHYINYMKEILQKSKDFLKHNL